MDKQEAEKYQLMKDYDFAANMNSPRGGSGVLLIPKNDKYISKNFGFGELNLIPYIQEEITDNPEISVGELRQILDDENQTSLARTSLCDSEETFLEETIRKFVRNGILCHKKVKGTERQIHEEDLIYRGPNYNTTRVHSMNKNEDSFDGISTLDFLN